MEWILDVVTGRVALADLVRWGGYVGLTAVVFTETGLLVGFFLPGDSLLITAGVVAATGGLDVWLLVLLLAAAAVVGDSVGYGIGAHIGPRLFTREQSLLFNPRHVERTRRFYARYGAKTIVLARFVPIVRTFAPVVAGVGQMAYPRFLAYNVVGGVGWVVSMVAAGYLLGQTSIVKHIELVVFVVILLSVVPIGIEILRERRRQSISS